MKIVYLMRGLPSSGKSYTARKVVGTDGVICETDEYFYTQVGDDPTQYDFRTDLLGAARRWNDARFRRAVDAAATPIVVDRGNSLSRTSQIYARYAVDHGYSVELREPESTWWQEIRILLKYRQYTQPVLSVWAQELARLSQSTHHVSGQVIRRRIDGWKWDLTVEDILNYRPAQPAPISGEKGGPRELPHSVALVFNEETGVLRTSGKDGSSREPRRDHLVHWERTLGASIDGSQTKGVVAPEFAPNIPDFFSGRPDQTSTDDGNP